MTVNRVMLLPPTDSVISFVSLFRSNVVVCRHVDASGTMMLIWENLFFLLFPLRILDEVEAAIHLGVHEFAFRAHVRVYY